MKTLIPEEFRAKSHKRAAFIMALYAQRNPKPVSEKEKRIEICRIGTKIDDSEIRDEHLIGFKPTIEEESEHIKLETEREILLNRLEKQRLISEVDSLRWKDGKKKNSWLVLVGN